MKASTLTIHAEAYTPEALPTVLAWEAKITQRVAKAVTNKADVFLLPEYTGLELAAVGHNHLPLENVAEAFLPKKPVWLKTWQTLADAYDLTIIAGTAVENDNAGLLRNRAYVFQAHRPPLIQDKQRLTRYEEETWGLKPGASALQSFDIKGVKCAVAICYDVEFPDTGQAYADAGVDVVFVPSATENKQGFHRVRIGAQARALEQQMYVVQAPLTGDAPWCDAIDINVGHASAYAPPDGCFPDNGILGEDAQSLCLALDMEKLLRLRTEGAVLTRRDNKRKTEA